MSMDMKSSPPSKRVKIADDDNSRQMNNIDEPTVAANGGQRSVLHDARSVLVYKALNIVLQHVMIPNLGWYPQSCLFHIEKLTAVTQQIHTEDTKASLTDHPAPIVEASANVCQENTVKKADIAKQLIKSLNNFSNEELLNRLACKQILSFKPKSVQYDRNHILQLLDDIFNEFYLPFDQQRQLEAFHMVMNLRGKYLELYHNITSWFQNQDNRHPALSLVIYQLTYYSEQWRHEFRLLELFLFNFTLYAFLLINQCTYFRDQIHQYLDNFIHNSNKSSTRDIMVSSKIAIDCIKNARTTIRPLMEDTNFGQKIESATQCFLNILNSLQNRLYRYRGKPVSVSVGKFHDKCGVSLMGAIYELQDGLRSYRNGTSFYSTRGDSEVLDNILLQSIYVNMWGLCRADTENNLGMNHFVVSCDFIDRLLEEKIWRLKRQQQLEDLPLIEEGLKYALKGFALRRRLLINENNQFIYHYHHPSCVYPKELAIVLTALGKHIACELSANHKENTTLAQLHRRVYQWLKRGFENYTVPHYQDVIVDHPISIENFYSAVFGDHTLDYYQDRLISSRRICDELVCQFRREGEVLSKLEEFYEKGFSDIAVDIMEAELSCWEQALNESRKYEANPNKNELLKQDITQVISMHRLSADNFNGCVMDIHDGTLSSRETITPLFDEIKYLNNKWFEWRSIANVVSPTAQSFGSLTAVVSQRFARTQLLAMLIRVWGDSDDVDISEQINNIVKKARKLQQVVKSAFVSEWVHHLSECIALISENDKTSLLNKSNLRLLDTCIYWVEKGVEVALLQLESNNTGSGRVLKEYLISEPFILELLSRLEWISEYCVTAADLLARIHTIQHHMSPSMMLTWLESDIELDLSPEVQLLLQEDQKRRAIEVMTNVASDFRHKFEDDWRMILNKELDEKPNQGLSHNSVLSLFVKL